MSSTHAGFGRCEGLLALEGETLRFEFQTKVAGIIKSDIKNPEVPLSQVSGIEFKGGLFSNSLRIQFKSLTHTQDFPRAEGHEIRLEIRRRDRKMAQDLAQEAKIGLMASSLDDMLEMTDQALS